MASLKEMRDAANAWAAQEKADIESGKKKVPLTSKEKTMAEKNKPLKTALVREIEPGRPQGTRAEEALSIKAHKARHLELRKELGVDKMQSAVETAEAQQFVGQLRPGLEQRTQAHHLQSREFPKTKAGLLELGGGQSTDLGRAVTNTIRREASTPGSEGSLAKLAHERARAGRSIAGPDPVKVPKNRSILKRGKAGKGGGGGAGGAPDFDRIESYGSHSGSSQSRAWDAVTEDIKKNLKID